MSELEDRELTMQGMEVVHMNPGAHALDRRLRELRAAQQALVSEARDLEADATYALLTGDRLTGVTAERPGRPSPRWSRCGKA